MCLVFECVECVCPVFECVECVCPVFECVECVPVHIIAHTRSSSLLFSLLVMSRSSRGGDEPGSVG